MSDPVILANQAKVYSEPVFLIDKDDGVHVRADGVEIVSCQIKDMRPDQRKQLAHCDAVQLIPPGKERDWFSLGLLSDVTVMNCRIDATDSQLQGLTGFDGLFADLVIRNNVIETGSQHKIIINGLLSGKIFGNRDASGGAVTAALYPARIGGRDGNGIGIAGRNVWIVGFTDAAYEAIDHGEEDRVLDLRSTVFNDQDVFLDQFDRAAYRSAIAGVYDEDVGKHTTELKLVAMQFGQVLQNPSVVQGTARAVDNNLVVPAEKPMGAVVSEKARKIFDPLSELGLVQSGEVTVGILFNNPMAIKNYERWQHDIARHDWPDFMRGRREDLLRFDDPRWGIRCGVHILLGYQQKKGLSTIRQLISAWAPCKGKGADNSCESTEAYIDHVSQRSGIAENAFVAIKDYDTARRIVIAMIEHENAWAQPYDDDIIDDGLAFAGLKMPGESREPVKPGRTSKERTGAILVGGGGIGTAVTKILVDNGLSKDQAATVINEAGEVISQVGVNAGTADWAFWLTLFNSAMIVGGAFWFWKGRDMAGKMGLR